MKNRRYSIIYFAASLVLSAPAHALTLFWDGTTTTANADGGNGTWDTVSTNWDSLASAGADTVWPSTGTDNDAVFGGAAGTVTIATGGVTANDLTFSTANYIIGGSGTLTLNGATNTITNSVTATINSSISSTVPFAKAGTGNLILGGANSFGTAVTMTYGTASTNLGAIRLADNNALGGVTILNGANGTLSAQARIELSNNITVTGVELRGGGRSNSQTTGATLVNISGDNTWAGAVRMFNTGGGHGIRSDAGTLTISGGVNSSLGGTRTWEIGGDGNVTITGAVTTGVGITKFGAGTLTLSGSGNNYTGDTRSVAGSLVINHANALSRSALDLATADTGTVTFGTAITAATLGSLKGSRNLSLNNTAGTPAAVTLSIGANNVATNTYTGELSGLGHLYKIGTGIQILDPGSAASITIGSLSANGGNLILKSGTFANSAKDPSTSPNLAGYNIGAGARGGTLTIDGATLNVGSGNNLKIASTTSGSLSILSGIVTSNDMVIGHNGAGTAIQSGGAATVTNLYHQDGGTGNSYTLSGGELTARRIYNNTASTADFTLNLNGGTLKSASGTTNLIDNQNSGAQITVLLGAGNTIIDTTASNASIVRPMGDMPAVAGAFTKAGVNTLTLTQPSTYSGGTTVTEGTLLANNSTGSATGSGAVVVNGGTLGGTGLISGEVGVNVTGVLSPGASIGILETGALSLNTGSTFLYEVNTTTPLGDRLDVNGNLSFDGTVTLDLNDLGSNSVLTLGSKFTMISYLGAWDGETFSGLADDSEFTALGNQWSINYDDVSAGSVNGGTYSNAVTLTVIPEPGTALLAGLGLLALLRRRR